MATTTLPGIREAINFNGSVLSRGPSDVVITLEDAETQMRAKSADLHVHRLYPFTGAPNIIQKAVISLSWERLDGQAIDDINRMIARRGPFRLAFWRPITESFWCAAGTAGGVLTRTSAYTALTPPAGSGTRYAPYASTDAGGAMAITLGAPDAYGRTAWTGTTLASAAWVDVRYYPIINAVIGPGQPSFGPPTIQGQKLTFVEV